MVDVIKRAVYFLRIATMKGMCAFGDEINRGEKVFYGKDDPIERRA